MASTPKYTTYVGQKTDAHKLLAKLFAAPADYPTVQALQTVDDTTAFHKMVANATAKVDATGVGGLIPSDGIQQGDGGMFPTGVKFGYLDAPDVAAGQSGGGVAWARAGDPANPYMPDISSPGPGKTDGLDKASNPGLATTDVPHTDSDTAGANTRNPSVDSPKVYQTSGIGIDLTKGKSGV